MVGITLQNVSIDFPVYNSRSRGLINTIFGHSRREQNRVESAGMGNVCVHALHDISLALKPGDRIGLIGRNGAGKTTLLRVLSGVYEPTRGLMAQEGRISSLTDIMLGMDLDASGYDNIVMRGIVMGLNRRAAIALIPEIERFTELGEYLQLPVRTYSQGMLLRLAFAVSTSITPDILLMDEMIGAGDASFVKKAQARINGLIDGVSILVLASHNESILQSFCTTGIVMKRGRIELIAPIDECLRWHREDGDAELMQI
ncbi:MAG: ABC transporter ATP-binding protein [Acidovorax sp.]|uniref:ABC transporter ATP-binding protein n=1 Tax=Acidovorax sp. TaxID=1872122 RepID=UPI00391BCC01